MPAESDGEKEKLKHLAAELLADILLRSIREASKKLTGKKEMTYGKDKN